MKVKSDQEIVRQNNRDTLPGIWQVRESRVPWTQPDRFICWQYVGLEIYFSLTLYLLSLSFGIILLAINFEYFIKQALFFY